jgi:hypothetical protein
MRIFIAFAFYFLYWFICFLFTGTDRKNLIGLRSYPDAVQKKVRARGLIDNMKKPSIPSILISNTLLFTAVFSVIGLIFRKTLALGSYLDAFLYFLALGEGLGLFDLVVIDLLWWRNTKRIRFSFIPEKEEYRNPEKHLGSFLRGIPLFTAVAALTALVVTLL